MSGVIAVEGHYGDLGLDGGRCEIGVDQMNTGFLDSAQRVKKSISIRQAHSHRPDELKQSGDHPRLLVPERAPP